MSAQLLRTLRQSDIYTGAATAPKKAELSQLLFLTINLLLPNHRLNITVERQI